MTDPVPQSGDELPLPARIEALLIGTDRPLTDARLAELLDLAPRRGKSDDGPSRRVRDAITELNERYDATGRAFRIERLAGGWQVLTRPEHGELLARLNRDRQQHRLSQAALETLAIIAYRQPVLRAEVEAIRGVACGEVLRGLLERRLVKIVGRAEELGRPMLYGTTKQFLTVFGLSGLNDLPEVEGLDRTRPARPKPAAAAEPKPEPSDETVDSPPEAEPETGDAVPETMVAGDEHRE
ncbi:MAG: SMC-Scp complex subunit ScpB [Planctomycetes bacterium]|nr:SMC-Scp complex subunit ScpB [Planctomycetota bacterium]